MDEEWRKLLYSSVEPQEQEWLMTGVPVSDVTLIAGPGGAGKDLLGADLITRVTRGWPMPDGTLTGPPAGCIMVTPEDKADTATVHRLHAAGADLSKIMDLTKVSRGGDGHGTFSVPDDLGVLRRAIAHQGDTRLVWISPIAAVSSVGLSSNKVVRDNIMRPLQSVAEDTGTAIAVVCHTVKSGDIGGSRGLVDAARAVLLIARDKDNDEIRLVRPYKSNLDKGDTQPLRYVLEGEPPRSRVRFLATLEQDAEAPGEPDPKSGQGAILKLLRESQAPVRGQELAAQTAIPYHTVRTLLSRLITAGYVRSAVRGLYEAVHSPTVAQVSSSGRDQHSSRTVAVAAVANPATQVASSPPSWWDKQPVCPPGCGHVEHRRSG